MDSQVTEETITGEDGTTYKVIRADDGLTCKVVNRQPALSRLSAFSSLLGVPLPLDLLNLGGKPQRNIPVKKRKYDGVGRNQPCPCGSNKKFKKCCMNTD